MGIAYKVLGQAQVGTSAGAVYTVPSATSAIVSNISIANTTSSASNVDVHITKPYGDPVTWSTRSHTQSSINTVLYANNLFVIGGGTNTDKVITSTDGITWTSKAVSGATGGNLNALTYGDSGFVGLISNGASNPQYVLSSDGVGWSASGGLNIGSQYITDLTFGNGLYVAVGQDTVGNSWIATSPTGTSWTTRTAAYSGPYLSAAYGNGLFVAGGTGGTCATSTDGLTWTTRSLGINTNVYALTYAKNMFVAACYLGNILTSTDGITWTSRTQISGVSYAYGITYGDNLFMVVGTNSTQSNGVVAVSTDLSTWSYKSSASGVGSAVLYAAAYGANAYVVGGGSTISSTSGLTPAAGGATTSNALMYQTPVEPNSTVSLNLGLTLGDTYTISARSSVGSAITVSAFGTEIS